MLPKASQTAQGDLFESELAAIIDVFAGWQTLGDDAQPLLAPLFGIFAWPFFQPPPLLRSHTSRLSVSLSGPTIQGTP